VAEIRAFPARLEPALYGELKRRADAERKSMNTLLNEALESHLHGEIDVRAALLRVLAALERQGRA
jgi:hypothetical protein